MRTRMIIFNTALTRAREALRAAKLLADAKEYNSCVNRLYYAVFYAINALLLKHEYTSSKHTGVRAVYAAFCERHTFPNNMADCSITCSITGKKATTGTCSFPILIKFCHYSHERKNFLISLPTNLLNRGIEKEDPENDTDFMEEG